VVFFFIYLHGKEHQIFGIRAIIEAIQAGTTVDKVYIQKMRVAIDEGLNESDEAR
jgi:23S rRNA (guanosine2251-2'-O)-methyltransferase